MTKEFIRKPNNYKSYKIFIYIAIPFFLVMTVFPIWVYFTLQMEDPTDYISVIFLFVLGLFCLIYVPWISKKQLRSKKSYMETKEPLLILDETGLTYNFNEVQRYSIPWSKVKSIDKIDGLDRYKDRLGVIDITCTDEYVQYIRDIKKSAYLNDHSDRLIMPIMYFDVKFQELYSSISEFYNNYNMTYNKTKA